MMNRPIRYALSAAGMLAFALAASGPASASFVAAICSTCELHRRHTDYCYG